MQVERGAVYRAIIMPPRISHQIARYVFGQISVLAARLGLLTREVCLEDTGANGVLGSKGYDLHDRRVVTNEECFSRPLIEERCLNP